MKIIQTLDRNWSVPATVKNDELVEQHALEDDTDDVTMIEPFVFQARLRLIRASRRNSNISYFEFEDRDGAIFVAHPFGVASIFEAIHEGRIEVLPDGGLKGLYFFKKSSSVGLYAPTRSELRDIGASSNRKGRNDER